jgi:hypothetical protein
MDGEIARFKLFLACANCLRRCSKTLCVPNADDAPRDIEELVGSAFLNSQAFECSECHGAIAEIVGINQLFDDVAA